MIAGNDTAKNIFWGTTAAATIGLIANGCSKEYDKDGRSATELLGSATGLDFLNPKVHNEELSWFLKEADMEESRDRTGLIMRLTDVKVTTLADLYAEGDGEIDIGELLDDPNITEEESKQLSKLNNERTRKALYKAVGELMELAGVDSALELKQMFPDESLLAAIMLLYAGHPEAVAEKLNNNVDTSMSEADRNLAEKVRQIGQIDDIEVRVENDRLWLNGFPFAYDDVDGIIKLRQADDPTKEIPYPLDSVDPINFREGIKDFYNDFYNIDEKAKAALGDIQASSIEWSDTMNRWTVKGLEVPANSALGVAGTRLRGRWG